jgi:hypothetical protein
MEDVASHRNGTPTVTVYSTQLGIIQDCFVHKVPFSLKDFGALLANFYLQNDHFGSRIFLNKP